MHAYIHTYIHRYLHTTIHTFIQSFMHACISFNHSCMPTFMSFRSFHFLSFHFIHFIHLIQCISFHSFYSFMHAIIHSFISSFTQCKHAHTHTPIHSIGTTLYPNNVKIQSAHFSASLQAGRGGCCDVCFAVHTWHFGHLSRDSSGNQHYEACP